LRRRGICRSILARTAMSGKGSWRISACEAMHIALPTAFFDALGLPRLGSQ
jgi:hypothetical protein